MQFLNQGSYDTFILDSAPTGHLLLLLNCRNSVDKAKEFSMDWWVANPAFSPQAAPGELVAFLTKIDERLKRLESAMAGAAL